MHCIVDADILIYRCGFACEKKDWLLYYGDGPEMKQFDEKKALNAWVKENGITEYECESRLIVEPVENALNNVYTVLKAIKKALTPDKTTLYLSGEENFRYEIATIKPYKGNRDVDHRPVYMENIREYLIKRHRAELVDGQEADDAVGIKAMQLREEGVPYVIVTTDKDLDMIPGAHYNWVKEEAYTITEEEAMLNFYLQLLTGDTTDNIQGIPGVGPAKAQAILAEVASGSERDMYNAVWDAYRKAFPELNEGEIDNMVWETGNLLWIRRYEGQRWKAPL